MVRRGTLEQERAKLLQRAGAALGIAPTTVTLERLCALVTPGAAKAAMERSAELRGLLSKIAREHGINRALMRQELTFLSHLTRLIGQEPPGRASGPVAQARSGARHHPPAVAPGAHVPAAPAPADGPGPRGRFRPPRPQPPPPRPRRAVRLPRARPPGIGPPQCPSHP